jgi:8-oxo-dGTP pyrophosphatase MutT (NUDIX family)
VKAAEILAELARYADERPEDAATVARFRELLDSTPAPFSREQFAPGHVTCSACVLSSDGARVVLLHHAKLLRWLQPGGHVEPGDPDPLATARREILEEAGLRDLDLLTGSRGALLVDVDIHAIPARRADPEHLHYDLRYALVARSEAPLRVSGESHALRWVPVARLRELTDETSVTRLVARSVARR